MTTIERINQLEKEVAELRLIALEIPTPEWPQKEDEYWFLRSDSDTDQNTWKNDGIDRGRQEMGNVFRTEQEVENYSLRLQSMVHRWKPGMNDLYITWSSDGTFDTVKFTNHASDRNTYYLGRCFKTKEEAIAHRDLYKAAWDFLEEQE